MKEMICVTCPKGCRLKIDEQTLKVSGNSCPRGTVYAQNELTDPKRVVTTTVPVSGAILPRCPVRTSAPVSKKLMIKIVQELKKYSLTSPVKVGQVVVENILGSGADVIVTRNL